MKSRLGSWKRCELNKAHKNINMWYFAKPGRPFYFCDLCLDALQKENQSGPYIIKQYNPVSNHRPDSKPEKDSL